MISVATIVLLLASVQCLSACTLASCAPAKQDSQLPPCHQHDRAPVANEHDKCDHQKAVNAPAADVALLDMGFGPSLISMPVLIAAVPVATAGDLDSKSPPGLLAPSVLRI